MHATITIDPPTAHHPARRRSTTEVCARRVPPAASSASSGAVRPVETATVSAATYRRRRAVLGIVSAVAMAIGIVLTHDVLTGSGGVPASAAASQSAPLRRTITAQPGDSLWSIASAHHGDVTIARYVDTLVDLNGGASIRVGQQVVLP